MGERKPKKVQTDAGVEFTNRDFKAALKKQDIQFYVTFSENKSSVVERFNRTLKSSMWRYFTHNNTYRYVDVLHTEVWECLPLLLPEKSIKNMDQFYSESVNRKPFKFRIGDNVRNSRY